MTVMVIEEPALAYPDLPLYVADHVDPLGKPDSLNVPEIYTASSVLFHHEMEFKVTSMLPVPV